MTPGEKNPDPSVKRGLGDLLVSFRSYFEVQNLICRKNIEISRDNRLSEEGKKRIS